MNAKAETRTESLRAQKSESESWLFDIGKKIGAGCATDDNLEYDHLISAEKACEEWRLSGDCSKGDNLAHRLHCELWNGDWNEFLSEYELEEEHIVQQFCNGLAEGFLEAWSELKSQI